jgi:hypothetical protein
MGAETALPRIKSNWFKRGRMLRETGEGINKEGLVCDSEPQRSDEERELVRVSLKTSDLFRATSINDNEQYVYRPDLKMSYVITNKAHEFTLC